MNDLTKFWQYMCDKVFGRALREGVMFWGPMRGESREVATAAQGGVSALKVSPGQWVHIVTTTDIRYYFDEAALETEAAGGNAAFEVPVAGNSAYLMAGHYDRIVPPGCSTIVATAVSAAGILNVQRQPSGRREVW